MKTFKLIFLSFCCLIVLVACEKSIEEPLIENEQEVSPTEKSNFFNGGSWGIPISARLTTSGAENPDPNKCGPGFLFADQRGDGQARRLGRFSTQMTFCGDPSQLEFDENGVPIGGNIPYKDVEGVIKFQNGDEAYFIGSGTVYLDLGNPNYDAFFNDSFQFTKAKIGGVMKTAYGTLRTNSRVHNIFTPNEYTSHRWSGNLIIGYN